MHRTINTHISAADNRQIFNFLTDLDHNNSKEWMDENRQRYNQAKNIWLKVAENILFVLGKHNPHLLQEFRPKDTISRITNNRRFQPDKPVYKDYFTFSIMDKPDAFSAIHISVGASGSFIGCGYHRPDRTVLKNIREAIDFEGEKLAGILNQKEFKTFFGGLSDFSGTLKTVPRGYDKNHAYAHYLRYNSYVIMKNLTEEEVISDRFIDTVEKAYVLSKPFSDFLKRANSLNHD